MTQLQAVLAVLKGGDWLTPGEIHARAAALAGHPPEAWTLQAITTRIRDLRKPAHGGHTVRRRRTAGGYEYALTAVSESSLGLALPPPRRVPDVLRRLAEALLGESYVRACWPVPEAELLAAVRDLRQRRRDPCWMPVSASAPLHWHDVELQTEDGDRVEGHRTPDGGWQERGRGGRADIHPAWFRPLQAETA